MEAGAAKVRERSRRLHVRRRREARIVTPAGDFNPFRGSAHVPVGGNVASWGCYYRSKKQQHRSFILFVTVGTDIK
jgi:hypothetical protein